MTSQKLCKHVGRIASRTNREAYEWRGSTVQQIGFEPVPAPTSDVH